MKVKFQLRIINSEFYNDEEIDGIFYHEELVTTLDSDNYRITVWKSGKKTEYLVIYEDFPNSNPTWIDSKLLKNK